LGEHALFELRQRPANRALTDIVKRVEGRELAPDPRHLMEVRLD
jgi:hypothetical protein